MSSSDSINSSIMKDETVYNISKVQTTGPGEEYVILGPNKYYRHELYGAIGPILNLGHPSPQSRRMGNPTPIGLAGFAMTCLVMSLYGLHVGGITIGNMIVGQVIFFGGIGQFVCGVGEILIGNTFGAVAMLSFSSFWFSYAAIQIPSFGIAQAYMDEDPEQLGNAIGLMLLGYAVLAAGLTTLLFKAVWSVLLLFISITMTFAIQSAGEMSQNPTVLLVGNISGVITGVLGIYNCIAETATKQNSYFTLSVFPIGNKAHGH
ncbi:uncharacterized protein J8A68_004257 [[Candida] subhashii]|uniref:Ammonia transport outward protein 2 n=1 Tax=[Candida] subhashii TaxID=561895 RepID=A0A8J5QFZ3_9ASCO|nr:uncharacterized protein J8A68_004257 [[Candida] subhashii]KAG7662247.1 hypothetical protein J8A68_004257 [[Candida] subhashii]